MKKAKGAYLLGWVFFGVMLVAFFIYAIPVIGRQWESWRFHKQQQEFSSAYEAAKSETEDIDFDDEENNTIILPQFTELLAINPDTSGWLELAGGELSMPVVRRGDNEYYLKHDFYNKPSQTGAAFLDMRTDISADNDNMIIYGHNLGTTTAMFNILTKFRKPEFVKQNPIISFDTLYDERQYAVFSVFISATKPEHGEVFDYINKLNFSNDADKQDFIDDLYARTIIDTGVEVTTQDNLLTLSTCTYEFDGARLVVVGRALRDGESTESFTGLTVTSAKNPLMPDIWHQLYQ